MGSKHKYPLGSRGRIGGREMTILLPIIGYVDAEGVDQCGYSQRQDCCSKSHRCPS